MTLKLGKKPARPDAIKFKFVAYFDRTELPKVPERFGHININSPWGMLANDEHSNCVFAGAAHETMVWCGMGGHGNVLFEDANVLADYSAVTGFKPADPDTDQGTDMQEAAAYRRKVGVIDKFGARHKVDAYVAVKAGDVDQLALATYLTGCCGVGLRFPDYAMDQFDAEKPWELLPGHKMPSDGHYVPCVGRNSKGNFMVVTWGRLHAMTPAFYNHYCDEAVCYLSLEALRGKTTPDGFDEATLRADLRRLAA